YAYVRGLTTLQFGGQTQELRSFFERYDPTYFTGQPGEALITSYFTLLLFDRRYAELRARIDRMPAASGLYLTGVDFGPIGPTPTALFRGWTDLLLGDHEEASKDGRAVLQFVERQPRTPWNGTHLEFLSAVGHLFAGDCQAARTAATRALSLVSRVDNAVVW